MAYQDINEFVLVLTNQNNTTKEDLNAYLSIATIFEEASENPVNSKLKELFNDFYQITRDMYPSIDELDAIVQGLKYLYEKSIKLNTVESNLLSIFIAKLIHAKINTTLLYPNEAAELDIESKYPYSIEVIRNMVVVYGEQSVPPPPPASGILITGVVGVYKTSNSEMLSDFDYTFTELVANSDDSTLIDLDYGTLTIELIQNNSVVHTTQVDSLNNFQIPDVFPGDYIVRIVEPVYRSYNNLYNTFHAPAHYKENIVSPTPVEIPQLGTMTVGSNDITLIMGAEFQQTLAGTLPETNANTIEVRVATFVDYSEEEPEEVWNFYDERPPIAWDGGLRVIAHNIRTGMDYTGDLNQDTLSVIIELDDPINAPGQSDEYTLSLTGYNYGPYPTEPSLPVGIEQNMSIYDIDPVWFDVNNVFSLGYDNPPHQVTFDGRNAYLLIPITPGGDN